MADDEGAVFALEVDGEGVEVGGEDDAVVAAPAERSGVWMNADIVQARIYIPGYSEFAKVFLGVVRYVSVQMYVFRKRRRRYDDPVDR